MATASKKKAATKNGAPKNGTNLPAKIDDKLMAELQAHASEDSANVKVVGEGNYVSIKGGVFSFRGEVWGTEIEVVILNQAHLNEYYAEAYDPNKKGVTPSCYALSRDGENMAPHASIPDEQRQNEKCAGCWASDIGSASVGKGKACKQVARIAFMLQSDLETAESASEATILQMKIPTMSKNGLTSFVKVVAENPRFKLPMYAVKAKIKVAPHQQYQFTVSFEAIEILDDANVIRVLQSRARGEAVDLVMAPFQAKKEEEPAPKGKAGGPAKKKAALAAPPKSATRGGKSRFAS